ncbi:MAG: hypothetical protein KJP00_08085 [Bacteroidia bacterium]|nr:hypothetical protein [Bacteroidia bacterium]
MDSSTPLNIHMLHVGQQTDGLDNTYINYPFSTMEFIRSSSDDIATGLCDYVDSHNIDLVAIYRSAKTLWQNIYRSSLAPKILFQSKLPLLFL